MARDPRRMVDLTWEEFRDWAPSSVVLVPLGAVEQHGPHLPLDTDTVIATDLCLAVAERLPAIVAPSFAYGYKSQPNTGGGVSFPGTTSFDGATFTACVRDIVRELIRQGVRLIALVNGNYENTYFAIEGIDLALRDAGTPAGVKVLHVNWWEQLTTADLDAVFDGAFPGWEAEHAGVVETSLMLHLHGDRVAPERIPAPDRMALPTYTILPEPTGLVPDSGVLASAEGSSAEIGASLVGRLLDRIEAILVKELRVGR
ncbi:MAG: creatinine amidohydrolase [Chloroflexota bacterium]|jgi:creatinine amidohydrolase|nr:creatinine amidohydrolase [Chloroflexota bacterium]